MGSSAAVFADFIKRALFYLRLANVIVSRKPASSSIILIVEHIIVLQSHMALSMLLHNKSAIENFRIFTL